MELGEVARMRVHESLIGERVAWEDVIELDVGGVREPWTLVATHGKAPPSGYLDAGRVLILAEGLGLRSEPLAGLVWAKEYGQKFIHQIWVDPSVRRSGLADLLVETYRCQVTPKVVFSGLFSPAGRAFARSIGAKMVNEDED